MITTVEIFFFQKLIWGFFFKKFIGNHKFITRKDNHTRKLASILTRQFLGEGKSKGESAESNGKSAESIELRNKQIELFKKTSAVDKMIEKALVAEMRQCKMPSDGMDSSMMTSKYLLS